MNVLIVDDERHVREAVKLLVDWESMGIEHVLEAADGAAAVQLIQERKPEIIFTDMMMPNMGGVELLAWAARHSPTSKLVVISGHDDFEFVRQTLTYGGVDYILKPIDPLQLNQALTKAIDGWRADEEARLRDQRHGTQIHQLKPVYLEQFLSTLITDPGASTGAAQTLCQEFGLSHPPARGRIALISLDLAPPTLRRKFAAGWDLLYFAILNIGNELLREQKLGYAFRCRGSENEVALLFWGDAPEAAGVLAEIEAAIKRTLKARLAFGLGNPAALPGALGVSYRQARQSLARRNLLDGRQWCHRSDAGAVAPASAAPLFNDYEERIRYAVQSGNPEQIEAALAPWFQALNQTAYISPEQLQLWWQEIAVAKSVWQRDGRPVSVSGGSASFVIPADEEGAFDLNGWKQLVLEQVCEVGKRYAEADQDRGVIHEIADYIAQFAHEDISLQTIAARFFLSREYISRKFKQVMNENISDYVTRIRIDRAKSLLLAPQLKISQIAEKVGFQDEKYFSKVFKKQTGCSPGEYRKQLHD
ncbi:two-component system response regulator YesN [Paenibacillus phyllosphaerae]|uniref:Two-component system response regulator YesN n=1 Tax=Paenibacillus phyllosphaerae TaxID=274593 RepID=A0A7W5AYP3_9BACL|nr:response regulator [Paenibacillus phyllosphaerae]MBB3110731.1 two-component system response regulator YesN [Paenibacillus phyllosphaerae]